MCAALPFGSFSFCPLIPMFEQAFKNIDNVLWKEAGCTTELDYTEQSSWLLFLKYLDGLEEEKATEAKLEGKKYAYILEKPYRWESWAAPKDKDGKLDHNKALSGDDLRDFVSLKLFPYLHGFKQRATSPATIEYKIGEIFGEIKNKITSGYNLREIIDHIDELRFRSQTEKHELSHLYEAKIKNMGNAGRNGGEYYTPRPLIRAIVQVVNPKLGERIYDGAVGSAGGIQWPWPGKGYKLQVEGCKSSESVAAENLQPATCNVQPPSERRLFADGKFFTPDGRAKFLFDPPRPVAEPTDKEHPFVLLTGRGTSAQWHTNTRTGKSAVLRTLYPANAYVELHPDDALRLKIKPNSRVALISRRARITCTAFVTPTVQRGQVFIPMHYGVTNQLTCADFDPHSRQPSYKHCAVRVEPDL